MSALKKNGTWKSVESPRDKKVSGVQIRNYTLKYQSEGTLHHYKAKLVSKRYTQTYGINQYQETFAQVAKGNILRVLLSIAAHYGWVGGNSSNLMLKMSFLMNIGGESSYGGL